MEDVHKLSATKIIRLKVVEIVKYVSLISLSLLIVAASCHIKLCQEPSSLLSSSGEFHCGVVPPGVHVDPFTRRASCMHAAANRTSSRCTARRPLSLFILLLVGVESNPGPVRQPLRM